MAKRKHLSKIIILFFIIWNLSVMTANASNLNPEKAELSQDFLEWLELSDEEKENTIMPVVYELPENHYQEIVADSIFAKSFENMVKAYSSRYSLQDEIEIRIKDQENTGECWAFSMVSALETAISKREGSISDEYSPRHMDYSCTREFLNGKINENGFTRDLGTGGTYLNGLSYYASGQGPILEKDMPFENNEDKIDISEIQNKVVQKHVEGARIFNPIYKKINNSTISYYSNSAKTRSMSEAQVTAIRNEIKEQIQTSGGVYTIVTGILTEENYNPETAALYSSDDNDDASMHALTIIGWDDNYSKDNFATKPPTDGAYICLNSYGEDQYDNGYTYVSYNDLFVEINLCGITDFSDKDFNEIYQYDELGVSTYIGYKNDYVYAYNLYSREDTSKKEFISEVGTYIIEDTDVEIYIDPTGNTTDYRKMVKPELQNNSEGLKYGYHVLKFKEPVELTGKTFRVVIKYTKKVGSDIVIIPAEYPIKGSGYENVKLEKKSYVSADGITWQPFQDQDSNYYDATIKAFTYYENVIEPESITLDKSEAQIDLSNPNELILKATVLPQNASKTITWSSSNTNVATVANDATVTAKSNGTTTITAKTINGLVAECKITVETTPTQINLNKTSITLYLEGEKTCSLSATILPKTANSQNNITWISSDENVAIVNNSGEVTANGTGNTEITATTENGKMAICNVIVKEKNNFMITSDEYNIDDVSKFIKFVPVGTNYLEFVNNIKSNSEFKVYDLEGSEVTNGVMKTGYKLKSVEENEEYLISVICDPSGDGNFNLVDLAKMRLHYVGMTGYVLDEIHAISLDINKDGIFNLVDCAQMVQKYLSI